MLKSIKTKHNYYVYVDCDPRTKCNLEILGHLFKYLPFYIGYGKEKRIFWHLKFHKNDKNLVKINKIKAIRYINQEPIVYKLREGLDSQEAQNIEKKFIKLIGTVIKLPLIKRGSLTNLTPGGTGGDTFSGRKLTKEHKEKIRKGNTGKVFSLERRRQISETKKKQNITISKEQKRKMVSGLKNMPDKSRCNISKATKNTTWMYNSKSKKHRRVKKENINEFLKEGWMVGFRDKRKPKQINILNTKKE